MENLISLTDLEQAINYWRHRLPAQGEEARLCSQAAALATPYAKMIMAHRQTIDPAELSTAANAAYAEWRAALNA